jgi:uncharacterized membrane-anchored protein
MSLNERSTLTASASAVMSKVPAVTLTFWIIKILATTLGETGGDAVTMSWLGETTAAANPQVVSLAGAAVLTSIFLPVLYAVVFRARADDVALASS